MAKTLLSILLFLFLLEAIRIINDERVAKISMRKHIWKSWYPVRIGGQWYWFKNVLRWREEQEEGIYVKSYLCYSLPRRRTDR